jgi:hypothetical protein
MEINQIKNLTFETLCFVTEGDGISFNIHDLMQGYYK